MNIQKFAQKGLVVNGGGEVLFIRYAESKYLPEKLNGKYALPGGKIEIGQKPDESVVSEVEEETGIKCKPGVPFYCWNWEYPKGEDLIQINAIVRLCEYISGEPIAITTKEKELDIVDVVWVPENKILELDLVFDELPAIKKYLENKDTLLQIK